VFATNGAETLSIPFLSWSRGENVVPSLATRLRPLAGSVIAATEGDGASARGRHLRCRPGLVSSGVANAGKLSMNRPMRRGQKVAAHAVARCSDRRQPGSRRTRMARRDARAAGWGAANDDRAMTPELKIVAGPPTNQRCGELYSEHTPTGYHGMAGGARFSALSSSPPDPIGIATQPGFCRWWSNARKARRRQIRRDRALSAHRRVTIPPATYAYSSHV